MLTLKKWNQACDSIPVRTVASSMVKLTEFCVVSTHTHSLIKVKLGMSYFALIVSVTIWPFCSGSEKLSVNGACTITTLYLQKYQRSKLFNWQIDLNFTIEMYDGQTKTSVFCCDRPSTLAITNSINIHVRETGLKYGISRKIREIWQH